MSADRLQFVTPLPPLPTGIAQYSRDLLSAVNRAWPLDVVGEAGSDSVLPGTSARSLGARTTSFRRGVPTVYQIGNSGFHRLAFKHALREPGVVVLHDVMLHHGRRGELLRAGGAAYQRVMRGRYGAEGARAVAGILSGRAIDDMSAFPLSEDYIERAIVTIVHSDFARKQALEIVPGANVVVVPMGIPLPALVDQSAARIVLRLPESAFIVASITHVNPYKRLPIVLRAMRRLVACEPNAILLVAGSVAPGIDLQRQVSLLNLERNVRLLGYVTDDEARLLARAADACVNLRFPSAGETSASLLRVLGAGRPVLVTDDPSNAEYPRDAVLSVAVDRFEDEMLADLMLLLARDRGLRAAAGHAARLFVEREHNMLEAVNGYRNVIQNAFGIQMPATPEVTLHEPQPAMTIGRLSPGRYSALDSRIADALAGLRLVGHDATINTVAQAAIRLGLDRTPPSENERISHEPDPADS